MRSSFLPVLAILATACADSTGVVHEGDVKVVTVRRSYDNTHLLVRGDTIVMVDAGLPEDAERLDEGVRAAGIDPADIDALVLSHGHADHAGAAPWFRDRYGIPVVAGAGDAPMLGQGHNDTLCPTDSTGEARLADSQAATFEPFVADVVVDGELDLEGLVGLPGRIVQVPGHTPGSLVLTSGPFVFVGDLFRGQIVGAGAVRHFYMCDLDDNTADIGTVLSDLAPQGRTFFTGHFGPVTRDAVEDLHAALVDAP